MRQIMRQFCVILGIVMLLTSCGVPIGRERKADLAYTIVSPQDIPQTLQEYIDKKQAEEFLLTYTEGEYLYIARGYGEQETGGYSIAVDDCYLGENSVCLGLTLSGPEQSENPQKAASYPYLVLRMEKRDEKIVLI